MLATSLPKLANSTRIGKRLVNAKFPLISLFEDVANAEEFDEQYRLKLATNPRITTEVGDLSLLAREEIPFGMKGNSYATVPFTHVNPDGSRFSDGSYGVLYLADSSETAMKQMLYHLHPLWSKVGLKYDRFVFYELNFIFSENEGVDATGLSNADAIYAHDQYAASRELGRKLKQAQVPLLKYNSVRREGGHCWALFTPSTITEVTMSKRYNVVWSDGHITVSRITSLGMLSPH